MAGALVAASGFAAPVLAAPTAAEPAGERYSNVRHIVEAGDDVGLNLALRDGAVDWELCEGWCNGARRIAAVTGADGVVRFTVREGLFNPDGSAAAPVIYRVEARVARGGLAGRRLVVTSPDLPDFRYVLKPVRAAARQPR